jgi:hypothetical protein
MTCGACAQSLTKFLRALWQVSKTIEQRTQVQTCPNSENRQAPAPPQVLQNGQRYLSIPTGSCFFRWAQYIEQVVRDSMPLGLIRLGRADIEAAIELR